MAKLRPSRKAGQISTLVDHSREGRFIFAFCPLCDHAEEAPIHENDMAAAKNSSITIIQQHLRHKHRVEVAPMKITFTVEAE
jgi:hypothetical protein